MYGELAFTPFDTVNLLNYYVPKAFLIMLFSVAANIFFVYVGFRPLTALAFDPILAKGIGYKTELWHYLLMTFVSLTTVSAFDSVGAILVVAMLVIPPNTALLFTKSVKSMLVISVVFSLAAVFIGFYVSKYYDSSISATIVTVSGGIMICVLFLQKIFKFG